MDHPSSRPAPFRVMLSGTSHDLKAHRDAVLAVMPSYDLLPVAMEYDAALPTDDLISASLKKVEQPDADVGIIDYRYGHIPIEFNGGGAAGLAAAGNRPLAEAVTRRCQTAREAREHRLWKRSTPCLVEPAIPA
jgi:Domain of unknown function (DUF4062)